MKTFTRKYVSGKFLPLVLAVLCLLGCEREHRRHPAELEDFTRQTSMGLYGYGGFIFRYDGLDCQIACNARRRQLRMQQDDQRSYLNVRYGQAPFCLDEEVELSFSYRSGKDEVASSMAMTVCRMEEGKMWLWSETYRTGIIMPAIGPDHEDGQPVVGKGPEDGKK